MNKSTTSCLDRGRSFSMLLAGALAAFSLASQPTGASELRAGCAKFDITPRQLPAIMNGGFLEKTSNRVSDPLHVRCLVLSNDSTEIAIAIVDSCMIPRDLCDQAKRIVLGQTGIRADRILIAATHTHSAPSVMDYCLGSGKDPSYPAQLVAGIAEGIRLAHTRLTRAQAGWAVVDAPEHTHCRRWLRRPGTVARDPFGEPTVRAMMHPGYQNPEYVGPAGPVDSGLSLLSIQTSSGSPLCLFANYSMHYFGGSDGFSADYFGDFARRVGSELTNGSDSPFVAIMSQGTSGDQHWMDYANPKRDDYSRQKYAAELADLAVAAIRDVEHRTDIELRMAERHLQLGRRLPDAERIEWAQRLNHERGDLPPRNREEVYAQQVEWIDHNRSAELVLQAIRIGGLGLTALPNEVYGITGLKLKAQSPIWPMMNLELANGSEGYIPPPEQHFLGGYTTWPARTAGLETTAEPKIVEALLQLLEQVSDGSSRKPSTSDQYNDQQRQAIADAQQDDNNRNNRGS